MLSYNPRQRRPCSPAVHRPTSRDSHSHPWSNLRRGTILQEVQLLDGPDSRRGKDPFARLDDIYIHVRQPEDPDAEQHYRELRKGSSVTLEILNDGWRNDTGTHYQARLVIPGTPSLYRSETGHRGYHTLDDEIQRTYISLSSDGENHVCKSLSPEERIGLEQKWGRPIQEPNQERLSQASARR